jgi:tRNA dimethylallyltransferase
MDFKSKIILIAGPTASGKSKFAIQLAKKINGEIINADSMQVYKELRILSARPSFKDYQNIKHHLYGFHNVRNNFSTGDWLRLSLRKVTEIKKRKKIPILVGGTGLYFKAILEGLVKIPNIPIRFRSKIRELHKDLGQNMFYKKLLELDPKLKNKINSTDSQRSIRAYEVKKFTNKSIQDWYQNTNPVYEDKDFFKIYMNFPRDQLISKINSRTEKMIKMGAIKEVEKFMKLKVKKDKSVNKAIGISEIKEYLNDEKKLDEIKEKISIKTRQYAKRQSTWARGNMKNWFQLEPLNIKTFLKKIK